MKDTKKETTPTTTEGWEEKLQSEFSDIAEAIKAHSIKYNCTDEDGSKIPDLALPLGFAVEWMKVIKTQAELRGEEKGRKITEERVELANNGYLCPNCYSTEHKYCGIPVKVGNPFASLTQEKGKKK